jgi:hypothetical protein
MSTVYQPGVCNIGPAEIRQRRASGYIGLALTIALMITFVVLHSPIPWRLFVIVPAAVGATGFLQARLHFCVQFGARGLFNLGETVGATTAVHEAEYRRKDQRKALAIAGGSLAIALAVFALTAVLP